MKFDVYGRFQVEVLREKGRWVVYRLGSGRRTRFDVMIPASVAASEVGTYLDDLLHELSGPNQRVRQLS